MYADRTKDRQALFNLLSNAAKFTDKGKVSLQVRRKPQTPEEITFIVKDTGVGMTPEQLNRIIPTVHTSGRFNHAPIWRHRPRAGDYPTFL